MSTANIDYLRLFKESVQCFYSFWLGKENIMANPVMHFEIMAKGDRKRTQEFYTQLFGWHVDDDNPMNYGMVDTHSDGAGIGGGISGDGQLPQRHHLRGRG